jgi:hypothetical protein
MKKTAKKSSAKKSAKKAVKKTPAKKAVVKKSKSAKAATKKVAAKKSPLKKAPAKKKGAASSKKKKEDLMCFLTSACVGHYGLPDNCYELETLRNYRDTFLLQNTSGKELVKEYYVIAPAIAETISKHPQKEKYYTYIFNRVQRSCRAIESSRLEKAQRIYQEMVMYLKGQVVLD